VVNLALVLGFDAAVLYLGGAKALAYLLAGTLLGGGLHPMAGHLIAEHYMFLKARSCPPQGEWGVPTLLMGLPRALVARLESLLARWETLGQAVRCASCIYVVFCVGWFCRDRSLLL